MIFGSNPQMIGGVQAPNQLAIMQSLNLYVYVVNNPIRYTDRWGLSIDEDEQKIVKAEMQERAQALAQRMRDLTNQVIAYRLADPTQPITVIDNGGRVTIIAYVNLTGTAVDMIVPESLGGDGVITYGQAFIGGTTENWSGNKHRPGEQFDYRNVRTIIIDASEGMNPLMQENQATMEVIITYGAGRARRSGAWSLENVGTIHMYTSNSRGEQNSLNRFMNVSAHEFGHTLGVRDGFGWGYNDPDYDWEHNTRYGNVHALMVSSGRAPATRLDLEMVLRVHFPADGQSVQRAEWPNASNPNRNRDLIERYGRGTFYRMDNEGNFILNEDGGKIQRRLPLLNAPPITR